MTDPNLKHPNYNDRLLPTNTDLFKPEFKRDSRGRYFMQLPGYGKWMVSVEPGSKIIAQGSQDEAGGPATDPGSIRTGSLHADTVITVGDSIYLNAGSGCIYVGDYTIDGGTYLALCKDGIQGITNNTPVFAFLLEEQTWEWRSGEKAGRGDVLIGNVDNDEFIYWNNDEGKLYIEGDLIIHGDLQSANFITGVSGWRLGYYDDTAEFQDVWVRGKINMEAGSSGDADYIDESAGRKWAAESGADITGGHTSNNTNNVDFATATNTATGAARGLNAINASYRYQTWLQSSDMQLSGVSSGPAVVIDQNGIYGYSATQNTFQLNALTGDALFRGTVYASAGLIGGWAIDADRIWNQLVSGGNYTKLELNVREASGINMHIQAFTDTNSNYTSPTGIQITPGVSTSPDPRLDIYDNGTRRVTLNTTGLRFYASDGTTVTSQILMGTSDGDVTFGGGAVRLWSSGVRVTYPNTINMTASGGQWFRLYCSGNQSILEAASDSYGISMRQANGSTNVCTFIAGSITTYAPVRPNSNLAQNLGTSSRNFNNLYAQNISYGGTFTIWMTNSFVVRESGSSVWAFYINGSDSYMGAGQNNAKIHANNNITLDTNSGSIWLVGNVTKTSGTFTIDHPLKPKTHLLQHSFVESPEMMNLYRGRAVLTSGRVTVTMPSWFVALNGETSSDYSYHLTSVGGQNDLWVDTEMNSDGEVIFGGTRDMSFDYLITATRRDPWAEDKRVEVEITKESVGMSGKYIYPEHYSDARDITADARIINTDTGTPE